MSSSSAPDNAGANTVAGNGTAPSAPPELALASAHGLGAGGGVDAGTETGAGAAEGEAGGATGATGAGATGATGAAGAEAAPAPGVSAGTPSIAVGSYATAPATADTPAPSDAEDDEATEAEGPVSAAATGADTSSNETDELPLSCDAFGCFGSPIRSAASCSHSGGLSRNDVWFRSIRAAGTAACAGTSSEAPYSSSYRRITSPTGNPGHNVASPLSRAITSR